MTRSEIPQLEVITAISDADSEDFVAQLLFSQGWNIIYRAFDTPSLKGFLNQRGVELRTVIVYQNPFPGFDHEILNSFDSPSITFISLDEIEFNSHEIMVAIRNRLRTPMFQGTASPLLESAEKNPFSSTTPPGMIQRSNRISVPVSKERCLIAVTGSTGAPGRTRFSAALAGEFAGKGSTLLVDADIRSQGAGFKAISKSSQAVEVIPLDRERRLTRIPEGVESAVVDLGVLPGLAEAVNDRRWYGSLINNVLDQATHLVYISKSTSASVAELSHFLREYPLLLKRLPVSYICVLSGHSRELREWESKFLTLTTGESRHILRDGDLNRSENGRLFGALRLGTSKERSIAKIAAALK